MRRIRTAVIGAGFIGPAHVEAVRRLGCADVMVLAEVDPAVAEKKARMLGLSRFTSNIDEVLSDPDIDVVHVCTPNDLHYPVSKKALEAGKHVVCEKPLARTLADAREMLDAAERAGIKLMYAELICFAPRYMRAKELMDEGAFGRVFQIKHGESHYGPHSDWF